ADRILLGLERILCRLETARVRILVDDRRLDLPFDRARRSRLRLVDRVTTTDLEVGLSRGLGRRRRPEIRLRRVQRILLLLATREHPPGQAEGNERKGLSHGVSFSQSLAVDSLRLVLTAGFSNIHASPGSNPGCV